MVPQFRFEDGRLYIETDLAQIRMAWQPEPVAEELLSGCRRWRPLWPEFRLLRPADPTVTPTDAEDRQKQTAFAAFREQVAPEIATAVEGFGCHQWALMLLLRDQPQALDLVNGNPVLAFALANNGEFRSVPATVARLQARAYSHRRQRTILAWLGFPGTESMARLLRRIPPAHASPLLLRRLLHRLAAEPAAAGRLAHLPQITADVLDLITTPEVWEWVTPQLLLEVIRKEEELAVAPGPSPAEIIFNTLTILHHMAPHQPASPFRSLAGLRRFWEQTDAAYRIYQEEQEEAQRQARAHADALRARRSARRERQPSRKDPDRPFPPPPIPGTAQIIPITTPQALGEEGSSQNNCVVAYASLIRGGNFYIYRVLAPERATLSIRRHPDGEWHRSEIEVAGNHPAHPTTRAHVDNWLRQHRLSI